MPFVECPLCSRRYPKTFVARHALFCNGIAKRPVAKAADRKIERKKLTNLKVVAKFAFKQHNVNRSIGSSRPRSLRLLQSGNMVSLNPSADISSTPTDIPGFHVFPGIFSDIHDTLFRAARDTPPDWLDYRVRRAKNYGPSYDLRRRTFLFGSDATRKTFPLPSYAHATVLPRLRRLLPMLNDFQPNQLAVNYYDPNFGKTQILPHNDCENAHIHTAVVGVSLAASCTFTLILRRAVSGLAHDIKRDVTLPPGSVYVMSDDSLRLWMHAIFPTGIHAPRISLTFRDISPNSSTSHRPPTVSD